MTRSGPRPLARPVRFAPLALLVVAGGGLACDQRVLRPGEDGGQSESDAGGATGLDGGGAGGADHPRADAGPAEHPSDAPPRDLRTLDAATPIDAPAEAAPDAEGRPPRALSLVLQGAPWYATQSTQGMAVDAFGRVYVGDYNTIYVIDGSSLTTYLTAVEAADAGLSGAAFGDFDIAPDGQLYIVMAAFSAGTGQIVGVVRSSAAHAASWWVSLAPLTDSQEVSVIADGELAVVAREGFWTFTAGGGQLIYDPTRLVAAESCATEDLAAAPSGLFLYEPGCNASPLLRGKADGTGVGILYNASIQQPGSIPADNFMCVTRDPSGGFYVMTESYSVSGPSLYHVAEDAQGTAGLTLIETVPTFAQAKASQNETFGFYFCSLAAGADGTVYVQTYHQLWKASP